MVKLIRGRVGGDRMYYCGFVVMPLAAEDIGYGIIWFTEKEES